MDDRNISQLLELTEDADVTEDIRNASVSITQEDVLLGQSIVEVRLKQEMLQGKKQDRRQRKHFAYWIFGFVCAYMLLVLTVVLFVGIRCLGFALSDGVLVTLLSTTTANVLGLFIIVAKYLFHTKEP